MSNSSFCLDLGPRFSAACWQFSKLNKFKIKNEKFIIIIVILVYISSCTLNVSSMCLPRVCHAFHVSTMCLMCLPCVLRKRDAIQTKGIFAKNSLNTRFLTFFLSFLDHFYQIGKVILIFFKKYAANSHLMHIFWHFT